MNQRCEICDSVFSAHMDSSTRYCKLCEQMIDSGTATPRRLCSLCGKPIPSASQQNRYCTRCTDVAEAWLHTHAAKPRQRQRSAAPPDTPPKATSAQRRSRRRKATIPEVNRAAREAGLSYGRYVSQHLSQK